MIAKQLQFWNTISMVPQGGNIVPQFLCAVNHMQITCYEGYFGIFSRPLRAIYLQTEGRPVTHRRHEPKWNTWKFTSNLVGLVIVPSPSTSLPTVSDMSGKGGWRCKGWAGTGLP
eukprot:jgi/Botrbrau1/15253/Bobra.0228s0006.1